jgi:dihydroorotate dehydrogenase
MVWSALKRIFFQLDAEAVHHLSIRVLALLGKSSWSRSMVTFLGPRVSSGKKNPVRVPRMKNLNFQNRIGLAAGFDKNGEVLPILPAFGFGFAEIGTVTPRPQPGNPRPRLFRVPEKEILFNRMGFNNLGAELVALGLKRVRESGVLPPDFRVGVNLGKNKDTSAEESAQDYRLGARAFEGLVDYFVINVSSPNTPGLRSLQTVDALNPIVLGVNEEMRLWKNTPPLFLKLAPELTETQLKDLFSQGNRWGLSGWVLSNTLAGQHQGGSGGWSGKILTERSRELLKFARGHTDLGIISVGGIDSPEEANLRLELGADLVQVYSGWIFNGPYFPGRIAQTLN